MRRAVLAAAALVGLASLAPAARAQTTTETVVFVRHGEKPPAGLGQLTCQGLNRALALPAVIAAKYGKPVAVFAPDPAHIKTDAGKPYDYVRPLATVEPAAIAFGLPIEANFGFEEIDKLQAALDAPDYRGGVVLVGWEHTQIETLVRQMLTAAGADAHVVPRWRSDDFDSIYVLRIDRTPQGVSASFSHDREGLADRPTTCP